MDINLKNYKLIKLHEKNLNHLYFIKNLFNDEEVVKYLGHLDNDLTNTYIIVNNDCYIGYLSMSNIITNNQNLTSITLYYAIDKRYRNKSHASNVLLEVSEHLLNTVDMLVLMIDINNDSSSKVAKKAEFKEEFRDDEDIIYTKYKNIKPIKQL